MDPEQRYSTAQVAVRVGVHRDTLLRWLREGRLAEPGRDRNGWRTFTPNEVGDIERFVHSEQRESRAPDYPIRRSPVSVAREVAPLDPVERLTNLDWDFVDAKTNYLTHR